MYSALSWTSWSVLVLLYQTSSAILGMCVFIIQQSSLNLSFDGGGGWVDSFQVLRIDLLNPLPLDQARIQDFSQGGARFFRNKTFLGN